MTARSIRRAAERKAAKLARKQQEQPVPTSAPAPASNHSADPSPLRPASPASNKSRCTGPTTVAGKAISSLNHLKHGLTGLFRVLESESQALWEELRDTLRAEHAPTTPTETLLIDRMAEHVWLSQRAQRFQDDELVNGNEQRFALFLRYQTTNDRAFYKCLRELATLRQQRRQFESQKAAAHASVVATTASGRSVPSGVEPVRIVIPDLEPLPSRSTALNTRAAQVASTLEL